MFQSKKLFHVFYHGQCPDGEMSAAIWKLHINRSVFYPWYHHKKELALNILQKISNGEQIVFLDICPSVDDLKLYGNKENYYTIIDHHKDAVTKMTNARDSLDLNITFYCNITFLKRPLTGCRPQVEVW